MGLIPPKIKFTSDAKQTESNRHCKGVIADLPLVDTSRFLGAPCGEERNVFGTDNLL